jgi:hypothetical protein
MKDQLTADVQDFYGASIQGQLPGYALLSASEAFFRV